LSIEGTIVERKRKYGSAAYMAQIAIMRERKLVWRATTAFDRQPAARAGLKKSEAEVEQPGALQPSRSATHTRRIAKAPATFRGREATAAVLHSNGGDLPIGHRQRGVLRRYGSSAGAALREPASASWRAA